MESWTSIKQKLPKGPGAIVMVKRENGQELKAYYHEDRMSWLNFYKKETSHFQCFKTLQFLKDVTHWMPLPSKPQETQ